jgi:hypothetical protein
MATLDPQAIELINSQVTEILNAVLRADDTSPTKLMLEKYMNDQVDKRLKRIAGLVFGGTAVSLVLIASMSWYAILSVTTQMGDYAKKAAQTSVKDVLDINGIPAEIAKASVETAQKAAQSAAEVQVQATRLKVEQETVSKMVAEQLVEAKTLKAALESMRNQDTTKLAVQAHELQSILEQNPYVDKLTKILDGLSNNLEVNSLTAKSIKIKEGLDVATVNSNRVYVTDMCQVKHILEIGGGGEGIMMKNVRDPTGQRSNDRSTISVGFGGGNPFKVDSYDVAPVFMRVLSDKGRNVERKGFGEDQRN